ncbi:hypothetical protein B0T18DRAFT_403810 [Schizothecium vesticola]|uniref:Uncharacterized protein n=1 Tax=Schizothecium vesticola TaxID=314040 RepID=A0AA40KAC4_9PEZI|nr:hypothetical protein B0T18DRAFT_403810 [Schizothecium vesticola]
MLCPLSPSVRMKSIWTQQNSCGPVLFCSGWAKLWVAVYRFSPADAIPGTLGPE